jgi:hypothetical protein
MVWLRGVCSDWEFLGAVQDAEKFEYMESLFLGY